MNVFIGALRQQCQDSIPITPFLLRTRIERNLFGLAVSLAGVQKPSGLSRTQVLAAFADSDPFKKSLALEAVSIFNRFTYLCDTSNWSDDGQDQRLEDCRSAILDLCQRAEDSLVSSEQIRPSS